jgi:hypothetical protein
MTTPRLLRQRTVPIPGSGPEPGSPGEELCQGREVRRRLAGRRLRIHGRRAQLPREADPGLPRDDEHGIGLPVARSESTGERFDSTDSGFRFLREAVSEARGRRARNRFGGQSPDSADDCSDAGLPADDRRSTG